MLHQINSAVFHNPDFRIRSFGWFYSFNVGVDNSNDNISHKITSGCDNNVESTTDRTAVPTTQ